MKKFTLFILVSLILSGCCEKKIDASSQEAFDQSVNPIIKQLPKEEAKQVFSGMSSIIMKETTRLKGKGNPFQIFDGMTESEFIQFAKTKKNPRKK